MVGEILRCAQAQGVRVYQQSGKLRFVAKRGAMTDELLQSLKAHKAQILAHLTAHEAPSVPAQTRTEGEAETSVLSCAQHRIWLLDQLQGGSAAYNMPAAFRVRGKLDVSALRASFRALAERHWVLRTNVVQRNSGVEQQVRPVSSVRLVELGLAHLDPTQATEQVTALAEQEAHLPFDLTADVPLRGTLVHLSADEHVLLITLHHFACDGWSIANLIEDLGLVYEAHALGQELKLPSQKLQYIDYARWQRAWLAGAQAAQQLDYWTSKLRDLPPLHSLPMDVSRARTGKGLGAIYDQQLSVPLQRAVQQRSRQSTTTLFMFLEAAFVVLLARYSDGTDIAVGTPVAGRVHRDTEELVGNFVNTLVLRTGVEDNPEFSELLTRTKASALEALQNQQLPFEKIVEHLSRERQLNANPIFQIMFALHEFETRTLKFGTAQVTRLQQSPTQAKLDLELHVFPYDGQQLLLRWVYNADLFNPQTIKSLAESYSTLLGQLAHNPGLRVQDVPLSSLARRAELLVQASGPARVVPPEATHQLIAAQARETPDAIAAEFEGVRLSYLDLERRANAVARRLSANGVGPGVLVGLSVRRSLDLLTGLLAIWKAGGAYVPLDPEQPSARIEEIVSDASLKLVLTHQDLAQRFHALGVCPLQIDEPGVISDEQTSPTCQTSPDDPAYVLYTSGSTGRPKGAVIRHRSLVNYLCHAARNYLRPGIEGSVVSSPLSFDATLTTLVAPLLTGAQVTLLADEDTAGVLAHLNDYLFNQVGSWLFKLTPAHLDVLAAQASACNVNARHVIVIGGEQLTADTLAPWRTRLLPNSTFINEYGPTETVVGCSVYALEPAQDIGTSQTGAIPIGRPIQNTQLYVLNPKTSHISEAALQPLGATGELYIGGAGVAVEYLNRARLSAQRFVPDPFSKSAHGRLYRTGDLVRRRADGELEFLGRTDHQIKLRGHRIEPGELEARLRRVPAVRDAVIVARRDSTGEAYLTAYVTGEAHETDAACELVESCRAHLAQSVPGYMVPAAFVYLRELPLTANGKLDRNALPEPTSTAYRRTEHVNPTTPLQQQLCQLWGQILGVDRLSIDGDFFQLGGHSLSATRLVAVMRSTLNIDVSLRDIFEQPNVRTFSEMLTANPRPSLAAATNALKLSCAGPLSFAQQRLRFIDQFDGESTQYSMFGAFQLSGQLDRPALWRTVDYLISRHEALRTVFPLFEGAPDEQVGQEVQAEWVTPIVEHDLIGLNPAQLEAQTARIIADEGSKRFDLTRDILLRVVLLACPASRWVMLVNVHHIAADGWSVGVLVDEFSRVYSGYVKERPPDLLPTSVRYLEFAHHQLEAHRTGRFERDLAYWRDQLTNLPPVHGLPLRAPRPATQDHAGASHNQQLPTSLMTALLQLCRQRDVTLFMALQTAFAVLLARYSNTCDIVTGTAISGREYPGSETTVGLFVNMLVLRTDLTATPTFDALLATNKATILDAYEHQSIPFDVLVEKLRPERNLSYDPLVQIVLTLQNNDRRRLELCDLSVEPLRLDDTRVKFDLQLDVEVVDERLELRWLYKTELFDPEFVQQMALNFETLVRGIVADPEQPILQLPLVHPEQWASLLAPLYAAPLQATPPGRLHEYFEAHVRRYPNRIAVRHGSRHWTYNELNQQSNRLAHYLIEQGVGPESLVGLCVEPSIDTLVGILAILKAGGAYVPVAPHQPEVRIGYILRDAAVELVLTQSAFVEKLKLEGHTVVCLDSPAYRAQSSKLSCADPRPPAGSAGSHDAAYVIYTSGSTGEPKGVCVEHRNVLSLLGSTREHFRFSENDVWTLCHSFAFDFSVWEIWGALFHGGCVVVVPVAIAKDPERLSILLHSERVTVLNQTPRAFYALEEAMIRTACQHRLRYVVFGGEALDYSKLRCWYDTYAEQTELVNMYGITETTVHVTFAGIAPHDVDATTSNIGRPLSSLFAVVCNECQQPQPIGCSGELLVAGAGVARGYLNRTQLNSERFVVLKQFAANRFYRTGDTVRCSKTGTFDYLGRSDSQLKIRGFRIEPGEIEVQLAALAIVKHCVVTARCDTTTGNALVAYVVSHTEVIGTEAQSQVVAACRAHLQARLPSYMVPSAFVLLRQLPLTTNGKVDYRVLPQADETIARLATDTQLPRNELESKLSAAWQEVLSLETVGIDENFFEVGGHSLATITLTTLLKRSYEIDIPVAEVFRHQTIRSLSDALRNGTLQRDNLALLLKVRGAKPPLFFLPPATGVGHCFMGLSASLPSDRPHYAFMTPGQETGDELPESVESLARRYLNHIRMHHGVLPRWYLAGYSVGGVVAYELGRQCLASGYPAPHLIMLDSYLPRRKPIVPLRPAQILYDVYGDDASRYLKTAKHLVKLFFEYRPHPAALSVTVFKATGSSPLIYNNRRDWQRFALVGVRVVPVSGGHRNLLEPENLPRLVQAFEDCFATNDEQQG